MTHDIIDNRNERLVDHIRQILPGSQSAKFAVGYFFLSGLECVHDTLAGIQELRLLIGNTSSRETLEQIAEGYRRLEMCMQGASKVTELRFPQHSSFSQGFDEAIAAHSGPLLSGRIVTTNLSPGGYNRRAIATIEANNPSSFWVDKRCEETWFSARLRAAAKSLHEQRYFGLFELAHKDGVATIRRLVPESGRD
ncbi:MAG: hypothetical protein MUQ10_01355 [Anaerolineae bacterium]|nr:hypothetical protein [Anaerolineae bacterium]